MTFTSAPWTPEEDALLEILAGTVPPHRLHAAYTQRARKPGSKIGRRTPKALTSRCKKLGISINPDGNALFSASAIAQGLCCDPHVVLDWCKRRGLKHQENNNRYFVTVADLCKFWAENPFCFDHARSLDKQSLSFILGCFGAVADLKRDREVAKKHAKPRYYLPDEELSA